MKSNMRFSGAPASVTVFKWIGLAACLGISVNVGAVPAKGAAGNVLSPSLTAAPYASSDPLLAVDLNRAEIIDKVMTRFREEIKAATRSNAGLAPSQAQLKIWLSGLRADQLLAASLVNSLDGVLQVIERGETAGETRLANVGEAQKALGDVDTDVVYVPITPCRIVDTRAGLGVRAAGSTTAFDAVAASFAGQGGAASTCNIPAGASAIAATVSALNATAAGFATFWQTGVPQPTTASVLYNATSQATFSGGSLVLPLCTAACAGNKEFQAYVFSAVDLAVDVNGYFKKAVNAAGAFQVRVNNELAFVIQPRTDGAGNPSPNVVAGASVNSTGLTNFGATIAGGGSADPTCGAGAAPSATCINDVTAPKFGTIGGGAGNKVGGSATTLGSYGTIAGGNANLVSNDEATIGGGTSNIASGKFATVAGGRLNTASARDATVGGGQGNSAVGLHATVSGGLNNIAGGDGSWAGGTGALVRNDSASLESLAGDFGTFFWADASGNAPTSSTGPNQFIIRANGGVGINAAPNVNAVGFISALHVKGLPDSGEGSILINQGTFGSGILMQSREATSAAANDAQFHVWNFNPSNDPAVVPNVKLMTLTNGTNTSSDSVSGVLRVQNTIQTSDRASKDSFAAISPRQILAKVAALPVMSWAYKNEAASGVRHIGPVAQDFHKTFSLGYDDKSISSVDMGGVALAAIKGLNEKLVASLQAKNSELALMKRKLAAIEAKLGIK